MHQHKIVARISLILSILNLVLAAPIVVRRTRIHEAYGDEMAVSANVAAMPKKWRELEDTQTSPQTSPDVVADAPDRQTSPHFPPDTIAGASDRPTSPKTSPGVVADPPDRPTFPQSSPQLSPDADAATASPQHSTSSSSDGLDYHYPSPPLSSTKSTSAEDYLWLLDRLQPSSSKNDVNPQESLHEPGPSDIAPSPPHPDSLPRPDSTAVPDHVPVVESFAVGTKLKILGVLVAGGVIGGIVGLNTMKHNHRETQDS